jgi:hypothetical protein
MNAASSILAVSISREKEEIKSSYRCSEMFWPFPICKSAQCMNFKRLCLPYLYLSIMRIQYIVILYAKEVILTNIIGYIEKDPPMVLL